MEKLPSRKIKNSTICVVTLLCAFAVGAAAQEQNVVLLWPNGAPGSEGKTGPEKVRLTPDGEHVISSVHQPSITVFLPPKEAATGAAVVIAPGGSHVELWVDHEGYDVAKWLSAHGVAGFVAFMVNPQFHMTAAWRDHHGGAVAASFGGRNTVIEGWCTLDVLALGVSRTFPAPVLPCDPGRTVSSLCVWADGAPGSEGKTGPEKVRLTPDGEHVISSVHQPSITVFLPPKEAATGAAVVIAPGGSRGIVG